MFLVQYGTAKYAKLTQYNTVSEVALHARDAFLKTSPN